MRHAYLTSLQAPLSPFPLFFFVFSFFSFFCWWLTEVEKNEKAKTTTSDIEQGRAARLSASSNRPQTPKYACFCRKLVPIRAAIATRTDAYLLFAELFLTKVVLARR